MKKILGFIIVISVFVLIACGSGGSSLTVEQQDVWDLIEERLEEGYETWVDLWEWANDVDIPWGPRVDGERPDQALIELVREYGLVYIYLESEPGFGDEALGNEEEIIVLSHFELYTYNEAVREMALIGETDGEGLDYWLENGGLTRLEETFANVEILAADVETDLIFEMKDLEQLEFVEWLFATSGAISFERSQIVIIRYYEEIVPTTEEVQAILIEAIEGMDRTEHMEVFGRSSTLSLQRPLDRLSEWLGLEVYLLELASIENVSVSISDRDGERPSGIPLDETEFIEWDFIYDISDTGEISLTFIMIHYIEQEPEPEEATETEEVTVTTEFRNALRSGRDYLRFMNFSFESLTRQLEFERFSNEAVAWAMEQIDAETDWYAQAVGSAETYLSFMSFSPPGLIDQLVFEGFTRSQAEHAVGIVFD